MLDTEKKIIALKKAFWIPVNAKREELGRYWYNTDLVTTHDW